MITPRSFIHRPSFPFFTASQHSGTIEEDYSLSNDLDKGDLNSSIDQDQDCETADEESFIFQCPVCERDYIDLEQ